MYQIFLLFHWSHYHTSPPGVNNHLIETVHKHFHRSAVNLIGTDTYNKSFLVLKGNEMTILPLRMEKYKETATGKKNSSCKLVSM